MATISDRVTKCIEYRFPTDRITANTRFFEDLNIDSLGMLELIMDLEDEFNVNIPTNKSDEVRMVQDITNMLSNWNDEVIDNAD